MRKILLFTFISIFCAILFADGTQPPGSGSSSEPYLITTLDHLLWVSTNSSCWGSFFELRANIDASGTASWNGGEGFSPIGNASTPFTGEFNGYFGSIDGLSIARGSSDYQGLFGYLDDAVIEYTEVTNFSVIGANRVGGLIGYATDSYITGCDLTGTIQGGYRVGGIAGQIDNTTYLGSCTTEVTIISFSNGGGGIVGDADNSSVDKCSSVSDVSGSTSVGGILGGCIGSVISCCFSTGDVYGTGYNVGGLCGNIDNSSVHDCYSWSSVTGAAIRVGGFSGCMRNSATVDNSYSIGSVAGNSSVGGLIGSDYTGNCSVTDSFWDTEASGLSSSAGGTGKSTVEMKTASTFLDSGWDWMEESANGTNNYWGINPAENNGYPFLKWQNYENFIPIEDLVIDTNTQWSTDQTLGRNVVIQNGATLTIDPGVSVQFTEQCTISVENGRILAIGTESQEIDFFGTPSWGGIQYISTTGDSSKFVFCEFYGATNLLGGALHVEQNDHLLLRNCTFLSNTADVGGGAIYLEGSSPRIIRCLFDTNVADGSPGGAICAISSSSPEIINCSFVGNEASSGGAIYALSSGCKIINSLFNSNTSYGDGGGCHFTGTSSPLLEMTNCTVVNNSASSGGGIYSRNAQIYRNNIVWDNSSSFDISGSSSFYYCNISGYSSGALSGTSGTITGCIDALPLIENLSTFSYDLNVNSPCINTGDPNTVLEGDALLDLNGNDRYNSNGYSGVLGSAFDTIDIGAVEYQDFSPWLPTLTIDQDVQLNDTFNLAYGNTLTISPGVTLSFASGITLNLYGALIAEGTPDSVITFTAVSPGSGWEGLHFLQDGDSHANSSRMECCTVEYGQGTNGGNIYLDGDASSGTEPRLRMRNCHITQGNAQNGGAFYVKDTRLELINCILDVNSASLYGGAIYNDDSNIELTNCDVLQNSASTAEAIYADIILAMSVRNSIVWGDPENLIYPSTLEDAFYYSIVSGGYPGTEVISDNPCFANAASHDYSLEAWSPALNAGLPDTTGLDLPELDFSGNPRIHEHPAGGRSPYDRIDIGAFEFDGCKAPVAVDASDGSNDYAGYVHIEWQIDESYQPQPDGFRIYRDNVQIGSTSPSTLEMDDDNVSPGEIYLYEIEAFYLSESGRSRKNSGFIKPDGIITGSILTLNNNPSPGVTVALDPSPSYCLVLNATASITLPDPQVDLDYDFTLECWFKTSQDNQTILFRGPYQLSIDSSGKLIFTDGLNTIEQQGSAIDVCDDEWHHVAVVNDFTNTKVFMYLDGTLASLDSLYTFANNTLSDIQSGSGFVGSLDDIRIWNISRSMPEILSTMNITASYNSDGLMGYWPLNESQGDDLFDATNYCHHGSASGCTWSGETAEITLGAVTDEYGLYSITQIPYGNGTTFHVIPTLTGHGFQPQQILVTLNPSNTAANGIDFVDNSYIPLSGHVMYNGTTCPVVGATIYLRDSLEGDSTAVATTDSDGYYVFEVNPSQTCIVSASYRDHWFHRTFWNLQSVTAPVSNINFYDMFTTDLCVQVTGGSDAWPLGSFDVTTTSICGCYTAINTDNTWSDGRIIIADIPPLNYSVTVSPSGDDPFDLAIDAFFQDIRTQVVSLEEAEIGQIDTLCFNWHAPMELEVSWDSELELKHFDGAPSYEFYVLQQNHWYNVIVKALEDYRFEGHMDQISYLTNCSISINDEIGSTGGTDGTISSESGYVYTFAPYLPNILSGYERQYQNRIVFTVTDNDLDRSMAHTDWALTQGVRPLENTYATTSPELPFMILHDPPGDQSYASFCESSSHTVSIGSSVCTDTTSNTYKAIHLGLDFTSSSGLFFCVETDIDLTDDYESGISTTSSYNDSYEQSITFTTSQEYNTSDSDEIIGPDADLYIGGAVNLIWGVTKTISWIDSTSSVLEGQDIMVTPDGFATQYFYTEHQILNNVIPNLIMIGQYAAAEKWQDIIDMNSWNRTHPETNPNHPGNVSFNAGAGYTYSEETTLSEATVYEFEATVSNEFGLLIGGTVNGIGSELGYTFDASLTIGSSQTTTVENTTSCTFVLGDDDLTSELNEIPDYFTLDIGKDPVYGTPVFDLIAGASSCPWEPETLPRDGVTFGASADSIGGLQNGSAAVFALYLGNSSQSGEDRRYYLEVQHGTNPTGATVRVNGVPLEGAMAFDIEGGETATAYMTIEQGPGSYQISGLTLEFYAEGDRGNSGPDGHFFDIFRSFGVSWETPYSLVEILQPEEGWILNQECGNMLEVILTGYDTSISTLQSLKLEYRDPNESLWIPGLEIVRDSLEVHPHYIVEDWDVSGITDGMYQIRAVAVDSIHTNYHTTALNGVIDREPPEVWGVPEPVDDLLGPDDIICVRFNEAIDPGSVLPDGVSLQFEGGNEIDITVQIDDSELSIVPDWDNSWLENHTLIARVTGISDLYGNRIADPIEWRFYVNASPIGWSTTKIELIKPLGEEATFEVDLVNDGGQTCDFTLEDLPAWLSAQPMEGQLAPLDSETISFTVSSQIGFGSYEGTLNAVIPGFGNEPLTVEVSVLANPPSWASTWDLNYDYTMSITGCIMIEEEVSEDPFDIIGAFIQSPQGDWECRGVAQTEFVEYLEGVWQFFLTIHSDVEYGEALQFRVWDNSQAKEYYGIDESYSFLSGATFGSPILPDTIHVSGALVQEIDCANGWTWLSLNLVNENSMTLDDVLQSLNCTDGDLIKSQTAYAQFTTSSGWVGTLDSLNTVGMFKLNLSSNDNLRHTGMLEDPETTLIEYGSGWNWIGYIPHVSISVDEALAGITNQATGDVIKSQRSFAQYIEGYGWIGSLRFMNPGHGYMLQAVNSGSFTYPHYTISRCNEAMDVFAQPEIKLPRDDPSWQVNPLEYEYSSNITSVIQANGEILNTSDITLAAFCGDECRGIAEPVFVMDQWTFFLTQYANTMYETMHYRVYDSELNIIHTLSDTLVFISNQILGDPLDPYVFNIQTAGLTAPQNVQIVFDGNSVQLSWDSVSGTNSYHVYHSDNPNGGWVEITELGDFSIERSDSPATRTRMGRITWETSQQTGGMNFYRITSDTEASR